MRKIRVRAVISHNGKFLFVKHKHDDSFWALPGGGLDDGETLTDGIRRELIEELGVEPHIGRVLYIHQLFRGSDESLEFFFEILNGSDYQKIDLSSTSHGLIELADAVFIHVDEPRILPDFLRHLPADLETADWPKYIVRNAER